jgi:hypothetical protein
MATVGPPSTKVTRVFQLRRDAAHPSMSTTVVDHQPPPGRQHSEHRTPHHLHRHNAARATPMAASTVAAVTAGGHGELMNGTVSVPVSPPPHGGGTATVGER